MYTTFVTLAPLVSNKYTLHRKKHSFTKVFCFGDRAPGSVTPGFSSVGNIEHDLGALTLTQGLQSRIL